MNPSAARVAPLPTSVSGAGDTLPPEELIENLLKQGYCASREPTDSAVETGAQSPIASVRASCLVDGA